MSAISPLLVKPDKGSKFRKPNKPRAVIIQRKPGLGLGLAISQEVVQAHGGGIEVGDSKWGGTLMQVMLPVRRSGAE